MITLETSNPRGYLDRKYINHLLMRYHTTIRISSTTIDKLKKMRNLSKRQLKWAMFTITYNIQSLPKTKQRHSIALEKRVTLPDVMRI